MTPLIECSAPGGHSENGALPGREPVAFAEAEQADHAVDVDEEQRFVAILLHMPLARAERNLCGDTGVTGIRPPDPDVCRVRPGVSSSSKGTWPRARTPRRWPAGARLLPPNSSPLDERSNRTAACPWLRIRDQPRLPVEAQGRRRGARRQHPPPAARAPTGLFASKWWTIGFARRARSPGSSTSPRWRSPRSRWSRRSSRAASSSSPCSPTAGSASSSAGASGWASRSPPSASPSSASPSRPARRARTRATRSRA